MTLSAASVRAEYDDLDAGLSGASSAAALTDAVRRWDQLKRRIASHVNRSDLRFRQDTADPALRAANGEAAALDAFARSRDVAIKRIVLRHPQRAAFETAYGSYVPARWELDLLSYDPALEEQAVREAALYDEYTELKASARAVFRGQERNLTQLGGYGEDPDRDVRREAFLTLASLHEDHRGEVERVYGELVALRSAMAATLGFPSYVELAYKRLGRTEYDAADVGRFRAAIERDIVPLAAEIVADQAAELGLDAVMPWDEHVFDTLPPMNISPHDALVDAFAGGFAALHPQLGAFARRTIESRSFDIEGRTTKAGGGFCTFLYDEGRPFVFATLNGTTNDVNVVVHEMGHAFQGDSARDKALLEEIIPTAEAGEVHSMSMEYLMWDEYERFVGDDAERYRRHTLRSQLLMLPYIAAIDHFQELVYRTPKATAGERNAMWRDVTRRYLPFRNDGDVPFLAAGAWWQRQRHIFGFPFYYIDYGLAMCCALQFWVAARRDQPEAVERYVALCKRGGEAPFLDLIRSAGLRSPFAADALAEVADQARAYLRLAVQA